MICPKCKQELMEKIFLFCKGSDHTFIYTKDNCWFIKEYNIQVGRQTLPSSQFYVIINKKKSIINEFKIEESILTKFLDKLFGFDVKYSIVDTKATLIDSISEHKPEYADKKTAKSGSNANYALAA